MSDKRMDSVSEADQRFMRRALELAAEGEQAGEVPVGCVIVKDGEIIGEGFNHPISAHDPTAHAEIGAMRQAATRLGNYRLVDTALYVTLEPCTMCAGAMVHARVKRLVYAAREPRTGAVGSVYDIVRDARLNHCLDVTEGVLAEEAAEQLRNFFRARR